MNAWLRVLRDAVVSGTTASLLSTAALAIRGRFERTSTAAPSGAPGQWVMGEQAAYERRPGLGRFALGYFVRHVMSTLWSAVQERTFGRHTLPRPAARHIAAGAATAALAYLVDYAVTPHGFRPEFAKHLRHRSMVVVCLAFGAGLALPYLMRKSRERSDLHLRSGSLISQR